MLEIKSRLHATAFNSTWVMPSESIHLDCSCGWKESFVSDDSACIVTSHSVYMAELLMS